MLHQDRLQSSSDQTGVCQLKMVRWLRVGCAGGEENNGNWVDGQMWWIEIGECDDGMVVGYQANLCVTSKAP